MTIKHLTSNYIDDIALQLSEDVYGANGDLDENEIRRRLIEAIHGRTGYAFAHTGLVSIDIVAELIMSIWEYMDKNLQEEMVWWANGCPPLPDEPRHFKPALKCVIDNDD